MLDHSFWHQKWEKNEIGFHMDCYNPWLENYANEIFSGKENVFVPLCGKTPDLKYLASLNKKVVGVEISHIAAQDFFKEQYPNTHVIEKKEKDFASYNNNYVQILTGDFFELTQKHTRGFSAIYDRASLIALPKKMRSDYVKHLRWLCGEASMLLITLDYDQNKMGGPPFSVTPDEVEELFSYAKVNQLIRKNIIDKEPKFKQKGLKAFYQTAYHIDW